MPASVSRARAFSRLFCIDLLQSISLGGELFNLCAEIGVILFSLSDFVCNLFLCLFFFEVLMLSPGCLPSIGLALFFEASCRFYDIPPFVCTGLLLGSRFLLRPCLPGVGPRLWPDDEELEALIGFRGFKFFLLDRAEVDLTFALFEIDSIFLRRDLNSMVVGAFLTEVSTWRESLISSLVAKSKALSFAIASSNFLEATSR